MTMKILKYFDGKNIQTIYINTDEREFINIDPDGTLSIYQNGKNMRTIKTSYYEIEYIYNK